MNTRQKEIAKELLVLAYAAKGSAPYEKRLPASIMAAQAIHETGWLRHIPKDDEMFEEPKIKHSFNILGIKSIPEKGLVGTAGYVTCGTMEWDERLGKFIFMEYAKFRAYYSYKECFDDYINVIWNSMINVKVFGVSLPVKVKRYRLAIQQRTNAYNYLVEIKKAGYATDPNYVNKVWTIAVQCKFVKN